MAALWLTLAALALPTSLVAQNRAPRAVPGGPYTTPTLTGSEVTIRVDGSASTDDVGIVKWRWRTIDATGVTVSDQTYLQPAAVLLLTKSGTYTLKLTAVDAAGASGTTATTITVPIQPPPLTITCPASQSLASSSPDGAPVTFEPATAVGGVAPVAILYSQASGSLFPVGTTTASATARSADGQTASCSFSVTVSYTPPPPVDCTLSDWRLSTSTAWSACSSGGTQTRTETWVRDVLTPALNGGSCGATQETRTGTQTCVYVPPPSPTPPPPTGDANTYFAYLSSLPETFKAYSLRDATQLTTYAQAPARRKWVTYDATMDAAKVVIPSFNPDERYTLADPVDATATTLHFLTPSGMAEATFNSLLSGAMTTGRSLRIADSETVVVQRVSGVSITGGLVPVKRSATPALHAAGEAILGSVNSLINQVQLPIGTVDGHTYLFTWDALYTPSMIAGATGLGNYKTFRFEPAWLQVDTRFDGTFGNWSKTPGFNASTDIGVAAMRSGNNMGGVDDWSLTTGYQAGPGITTPQLAPQITPFILKPNVWVRYWVQIEQRANDYEYMTFWVADVNRDPVKLFDRVRLSLPKSGVSPNNITKFLVEFNTSTNTLRAGRADFVAYTRNFVALQDVADPTPLLVRPQVTQAQVTQ